MLRITQANISIQTHNRTAWRYGTVLHRRTYNHASTPAAHRLHGTNPPIISSYPIQPSTHKLAHSPALPFTPFTLISSPFHSTSLIRHGRHRPGHHDHDHEHEEEDEEDQVQTPITPEDKLKMQKECTDITMRGVYWNITLSIFKFIGGVMGNSMAMIADAVHSLSDLVTDGITLWAARLTHKPQDADHPYGHGKFEAIGSLTISATLAATAGGIGWSAIESIQTIMTGETLSVPTGVALVAAVISIAVKEMLYHQTLKVGNRWNSKVVKANAWHHRSDSVSTLVAMVGVIGGMIHVPILDPIAGLFVSGLIMKAAVELGWDSLRDLTDENVDEKIQSDVSAILRSMHDEGVLSFHRLRGRAMGPFVLMDVHISVSPFISVSAAHQIAERARIRVRQKLPVISELLVHVDVAAHEHTHRLFEDAEYSGADCCDHNHGHHNGNVLVIGPSHISKIVDEYQSSRAEAAALVSSTKKSSAPSSTSSDSSKAAPSSATSLFQSIIDHTSEPAKSTGESSTPATVEATDDLSQLMRPQSLIERDVRLVLGDQSASYATLLKGVSHFTCHWNPSTQQLRVQLELAFHSDTLTIRQASQVAKSIEASILARIPDVHAVDIHLELTDAHIREAKKVEPTRELPPNTNGETNAN